MSAALQAHWRDYLVEGCGLFVFMLVAGSAATLFEHPDSTVRQAVSSDVVRRLATGCLMGLTIAALAYHPSGQRSGTHLNPAVTLAFWQLGRIGSWDAVFYVGAQFAGALAATPVLVALLGHAFAHPRIRYGTTQPGPDGQAVAFAAEFVISFILMFTLLAALSTARLRRLAGAAVALLIVVYVTVETPLSGMSMNPARTLGAAITSGQWLGIWLYFAAPLTAIWLAAVAFTRWRPDADLPHYPAAAS